MLAHARAEGGELVRLAGIDLHPLERPHGGQRLDLALRLPAGAEDARHLRVGAREVLRRHAARGAGADHAEEVRLDDGVEVAALGVEGVDDEADALPARGVGLVAEDARGGHRALQDVQRRLRQARALARHVDRVARGVFPVDALDEVDRERHGEQLLDVLFLEEEGHGGLRSFVGERAARIASTRSRLTEKSRMPSRARALHVDHPRRGVERELGVVHEARAPCSRTPRAGSRGSGRRSSRAASRATADSSAAHACAASPAKAIGATWCVASVAGTVDDTQFGRQSPSAKRPPE